MDGAGVTGLGRRPGDRGGQRPVHLQGRAVPLELVEVVQHAPRQVLAPHQVEVELRGSDVGEHGTSRDGLTGRQPDAGRAAVRDEHGLGRALRAYDTARRLQPPDECVRDTAGPALGHGEADGLAEHAQQPAVDRAAGRLRRQVGVQGVTCEQDRRALAAECLVAEAADGLHREAQEAQQIRRAHRPRELQRGADRRERAEDRAEERFTDPLEVRHQRRPRGAVAAAERVE